MARVVLSAAQRDCESIFPLIASPQSCVNSKREPSSRAVLRKVGREARIRQKCSHDNGFDYSADGRAVSVSTRPGKVGKGPWPAEHRAVLLDSRDHLCWYALAT